MPAAVAIPALISAGGAVGSGLIRSRAANGAAQTQQQAATHAGNVFQDAVNTWSPQLVDSAMQAGGWVTDAGEFAAGDVVNASDRAAQGVLDAGQSAIAGVDAAADQGNDLYTQLWHQWMGRNDDVLSRLNPYQQAGESAIGRLSDLADEKFQFGQDDPSYMWRLQQGEAALQRSAAARGALQSGSTLKALTGYAQGMASTEYQNAFNRFIAERNSRGNLLTQMAGFGERANAQNLAANAQNLSANAAYGQGVNNNLMGAATYGGNVGVNTAQYAGNTGVAGRQWAGNARMGTTQWGAGEYLNGVRGNVANQIAGAGYRADAHQGGANARAAGQVASGNAWGNTVADLANIGAGAYRQWRPVGPQNGPGGTGTRPRYDWDSEAP